MAFEPLAIAHATPYPWEDAGADVNVQVARATEALAAAGHRVVVIAPSRSLTRVHETRRMLQSGAGALLPEPGAPPRVLAVGEALPDVVGSRKRTPSLPVDTSRTIEELLTALALDVCHVHEPFAPSVANTVLKYSRALNVGTFHAPSERTLNAQLSRKKVERVFGRIDARLASFAATAERMQLLFASEYRIVPPGADPPAARTDGDGPCRIVFVDHEERAALRQFVRALRRLRAEDDWEALVVSARGPSTSAPLRAELRDRVRYATPDEIPPAEALAGADIAVLASEGAAPAPDLLLRALDAGAAPLASRLPIYEEILGEGDRGLLFEPRDVDTLAGQLQRLIGDPALRARLTDAAAPLREQLRWERVAADLEDVYAGVVARRHPTAGNPTLAARLRERRTIDVDLHMHTDHSHDCATPVEVLLATAAEQGLGAIAVTDHNVITGAQEAIAKAEAYGIRVILGEEVKTASQGEVIGLFIHEQIPRGMTMRETVDEIKRQGGVVYVPHPFDRMHAVPDYEHLLAIVEDVDAMEIYNPRVAIGSFNEEAERFAAKYRILAGAGSDSHVAQGLGSVRVRMPDFEGPQEFLESLRQAQIITKPSSLLYVQALKFLETKATPAGARKARRERRVRRAAPPA